MRPWLRDPFPVLFPSPQRQLVCSPVTNLYSSRKFLSLAHRGWTCGHVLWCGRGLFPVDSCVLKLGPQLEGFSRTLWCNFRRWDFSRRSGYWGMGLCFLLHWDVIKTTFVTTSTEPRAVCPLHWVPEIMIQNTFIFSEGACVGIWQQWGNVANRNTAFVHPPLRTSGILWSTTFGPSPKSLIFILYPWSPMSPLQPIQI